jgi:hypothetical protein
VAIDGRGKNLAQLQARPNAPSGQREEWRRHGKCR